MTTKICSGPCGQEKDISEFGTRRRKLKNGIKIYVSIYCKPCATELMRAWRRENPEKVVAQNAKLETKARKKKWAQEHAPDINDYSAAYYAANRDEIRRKEVLKSQTPEFKEKRRERRRKRRQNDPIFRLRMNVSNAINKAIQKGKSSKAGQSILGHLGYAIDDLERHLESQFDENMTWDNYGSYWHIDHIIPQSDLPFASMEEENFKKCWALSNLRPLEASQNIVEGARRIRHKKVF
jgi:hypothetical protein